jgi:hypothetical protein
LLIFFLILIEKLKPIIEYDEEGNVVDSEEEEEEEEDSMEQVRY